MKCAPVIHLLNVKNLLAGMDFGSPIPFPIPKGRVMEQKRYSIRLSWEDSFSWPCFWLCSVLSHGRRFEITDQIRIN
jgi:hypothetical protein